MAIGLLILRLVFGITMAAHGSQKLFGWFGGGGIAGTAPFMEQLGFRPGRLHAALAGLSEAGGGLMLALGFLTPFAAAMIVSVMLVATVAVHLAKGFFLQNRGYEYPLALATGALAVAFIGPGGMSLDAALGIDWSGNGWGLTALVLAVVGGTAQLLTRTRQPVQAPAHQAS